MIVVEHATRRRSTSVPGWCDVVVRDRNVSSTSPRSRPKTRKCLHLSLRPIQIV